MKTAVMSALNVTIPLDKNQFFYDDGYTSDLNESLGTLAGKYGLEKIPRTTADTHGYCVTITDGDKSYVHIFYKMFESKDGNIFNRAHEEVHALHRMGKLKYLFLDMLRSGTVPPVWLLVKRKLEDLADCGAVYALEKRSWARKLHRNPETG